MNDRRPVEFVVNSGGSPVPGPGRSPAAGPVGGAGAGAAPPPDDASIEDAADEIVATARRSTIAFADAIAGIVLRRFYAGDLRRWGERTEADDSMARLAARLEGRVRLTELDLSRSMAVHAVLKAEPRLREALHLGTSHVRAVARLPLDEQVPLLLEADAEGWSVRRLSERVRERYGRVRRSPARTGGPPRWTREVARAGELVRAHGGLPDADRMPEGDAAALELLLADVVSIREAWDGVFQTLRRHFKETQRRANPGRRADGPGRSREA